jgi:hypothetical protein
MKPGRQDFSYDWFCKKGVFEILGNKAKAKQLQNNVIDIMVNSLTRFVK